MALISSNIRAGRWEGLLGGGGGGPPAVEVLHQGQALEGVTVGPAPAGAEGWLAGVPIPVALLSDGVQTFLVRDGGTGETLGHFTIVAGAPLDEDIRAEVDLLRVELDLLKKAFRRHCRESGA
ncbi:MAG: hypothetical protein ACKVPY_12985 [Paracoccaceae bacterium]